jgi:phosphinothricin acetyltransferase
VIPARVGFKRGAWHDVGWWQLELRERSSEPAPTLTLEVLRRADGWERTLGAGAALLST